MMEPFIGMIITVGFNFAPRGWALCNGQLMSIAQNTALFSLLGTTYGGDGITTFALPNLQGRVPIHQGQGNGLTNRVMGEMAGSESVTLTSQQMPAHNHMVGCTDTGGNSTTPGGNILGAEGSGSTAFYSNAAIDKQMNQGMISAAGGNQPHNNMQPYLVINFCIALEGIFPSRS